MKLPTDPIKDQMPHSWTASAEIFNRYRGEADTFIETGTGFGGGIASALEAGFQHIFSIEVDEARVQAARHRFRENPNVTILHGDARVHFPTLIAELNEPAVLWLDAHGIFKGRNQATVPEELQALLHAPHRNHTILIDDMHSSGDLRVSGLHYSRSALERDLLRINPDYSIFTIPTEAPLALPNYNRKSGILVATINTSTRKEAP